MGIPSWHLTSTHDAWFNPWFNQHRRTTWTLLLVVSLLLLQDSGTRFLWTVELLHLLTHLRPGLRRFSLLRHNPRCSTRLCTMAHYKCIDWLIDWLTNLAWLSLLGRFMSSNEHSEVGGIFSPVCGIVFSRSWVPRSRSRVFVWVMFYFRCFSFFANTSCRRLLLRLCYRWPASWAFALQVAWLC